MHAAQMRSCVQAVKAAEDAAIQAAQAAQQAEAGGNPVDVVAKATLATTRCSQVDSTHTSLLISLLAVCFVGTPGHSPLLPGSMLMWPSPHVNCVLRALGRWISADGKPDMGSYNESGRLQYLKIQGRGMSWLTSSGDSIRLRVSGS